MLALVLAIVDQTWRAAAGDDDAETVPTAPAGASTRACVRGSGRSRARTSCCSGTIGTALPSPTSWPLPPRRTGACRAAPTARRRHRRSALRDPRLGWRPKPRSRWPWPSTSWRPMPPSMAPCPCRAGGWRWSGGRRRTVGRWRSRGRRRAGRQSFRRRGGAVSVRALGARPRAPAQRRGQHRISQRRPALPCAPAFLGARGAPLTRRPVRFRRRGGAVALQAAATIRGGSSPSR